MTKRILIVDDDQYLRDVYVEMLVGSGFEVDACVNGEEGLQKLHLGGYDLVLLDIMMPKLDGIGVLEGLKKSPPVKPNGPIILLTNLGNDPLTKIAKEHGVTAYLVKAELTPHDLLMEVEKLLGVNVPTIKQ